MAHGPEHFDVPVDGGTLRVLRWGSGPKVVLAAHGITGSSMGWVTIGRLLGDDWTLLAPDLRGRGHSADLPGPYGLDCHARDLVAIADHLGVDRLVLTGHSMGAYVAILAATQRPGLVERLLLLDGGLPLPISLEGIDPDAALDMTLGPAIERLSKTFDSVADYLDFWRPHPALAGEWNDDVEAYLTYDAKEVDGGVRSRCIETVIRADGRYLLTENMVIGDALRAIKVPTLLIRAPRGLFNEPPGIQPDVLVDQWRGELHNFADQVIDSNHYSIVFAEDSAAVIVAAIEDAAGFPS